MRYASVEIVEGHGQVYGLMGRQALARSWRYPLVMPLTCPSHYTFYFLAH